MGLGNGAGGGEWGECGESVAVIRMKIKKASIPRLVVVPEELTSLDLSDLIFFCKRNQM